MINLNHVEMIECVTNYTKNYTLIKGYCDVISIDTSDIKTYKYKVINNDYWIVLGNIDNELINDIFTEEEFAESDGITRPGIYEYNASIYYHSGSWEEPSESYVDYIDFKFIETFETRNRDNLLTELGINF